MIVNIDYSEGADIVSLFDGISVAMLALIEALIPVRSYAAYEIDAGAIEISRRHFPKIKHMGDVRGANFKLHKGAQIVVGGFPCTDVSSVGKRAGLAGLNSGLFYEQVRAIKEIGNCYFMVENNFNMLVEAREEITRCLGVEPIKINSALVSAQTRKRLYWTNIPGVEQPEDRNIHLSSVLQLEGLEEFKVPKTKSRDYMWYGGKCKNITHCDKSLCLSTNMDRWSNAGLLAYDDYCRYLTPLECERLQGLPDNYTAGLSVRKRWELTGNAWNSPTVSHIFNHINLDQI